MIFFSVSDTGILGIPPFLDLEQFNSLSLDFVCRIVNHHLREEGSSFHRITIRIIDT